MIFDLTAEGPIGPRNPVSGATIPINQNGVKPGPRKLEQFREACMVHAKLPLFPQGDDPVVGVKLFDPCGASTFLLVAFDPEENTAYGWCDLGIPGCAEFGPVSLEELANLKGPLRIGLEIDNFYRPRPLSQAKTDLAKKGK